MRFHNLLTRSAFWACLALSVGLGACESPKETPVTRPAVEPEPAPAPTPAPQDAHPPEVIATLNGARLVHPNGRILGLGRGGVLVTVGREPTREREREVVLWDIARGERFGACLPQAELSANGAVLVCVEAERGYVWPNASRFRVEVWELAARVKRTVHLGAEGSQRFLRSAVSRDGSMLAVVTEDARDVVYRYALPSGERLEPLKLARPWRYGSGVFDFVGGGLLAVYTDDDLAIVDATRGVEVGAFGDEPWHAKPIPTNDARPVLKDRADAVVLGRGADGAVSARCVIRDAMDEASVPLGFVGDEVFAYMRGDRLSFWNVERCALEREAVVSGAPKGSARMALSPNGERLWRLAADGVWVLDTRAAKPRFTKLAEASTSGVAAPRQPSTNRRWSHRTTFAAPQARRAVWAHHDGVTTVWEADTGAKLGAFPARPHQQLHIAPDLGLTVRDDSNSDGRFVAQALCAAPSPERGVALPYALDRVGFEGDTVWGQSTQTTAMRVHTWSLSETPPRYRLRRGAELVGGASPVGRVRWEAQMDTGPDHRVYLDEGSLAVHPPGGGAPWSRGVLKGFDTTSFGVGPEGRALVQSGGGSACLNPHHTGPLPYCDARVWAFDSRTVTDTLPSELGSVFLTPGERDVLDVGWRWLRVRERGVSAQRRVDLRALGLDWKPRDRACVASRLDDIFKVPHVVRAPHPSIVLSPDGERLVWFNPEIAPDGRGMIYALDRAQPSVRLREWKIKGAHLLAIDRTGAMAATSKDDRLMLWGLGDRATQREVRLGGEVWDAAFAGARVAVAYGTEGAVAWLDAVTGARLGAVDCGLRAPVTMLAASLEGGWVACGARDRIHVVDMASGAVRARMERSAVRIGAAGATRIWTQGWGDVVVYDATNGAETGRLASYIHAALSPTRDEVVAVGRSGLVTRFDVQTGAVRAEHTRIGWCNAAALAPVGERLVCTDDHGGARVSAWDGSGAVKVRLTGERLVGFSGGGRYVVFERHDPYKQPEGLVVFDASTGARVGAMEYTETGAPVIALDAHDRRVALGYPNGRVHVHALDTGELLWSLPSRDGAGVTALAFDGAGARLVVADQRHRATVWSME